MTPVLTPTLALTPVLTFITGFLALTFKAWRILLAPALTFKATLAFGAALTFKATLAFGAATFLTFNETFGTVALALMETFGILMETFGTLTLMVTLAFFEEQTDLLSVIEVQATSVYPAQHDAELGITLALTAVRAAETAALAFKVKTKSATEVTSPWIFGTQ